MSIGMKDFKEEKREFTRDDILTAFSHATADAIKDMDLDGGGLIALVLFSGVVSSKVVTTLFGDDDEEKEAQDD